MGRNRPKSVPDHTQVVHALVAEAEKHKTEWQKRLFDAAGTRLPHGQHFSSPPPPPPPPPPLGPQRSVLATVHGLDNRQEIYISNSIFCVHPSIHLLI